MESNPPRITDVVELDCVATYTEPPIPSVVTLRFRSLAGNALVVAISGESALRLREQLDRYLPPRQKG